MVVLVVALGAVLLPSAATAAFQGDPGDCRRGFVIEGRCVTVDRQATDCTGDACLEFVEGSTLICPGDTFPLGPDAPADAACSGTEPALQRDDDCPEGARGVVGSCFIYIGLGPDGCFPPSVLDDTNNCRRPVADATGSYYCTDPTAELFGTECSFTVAQVPSPCPVGTTRFDNACWQTNGLTAPESCGAHGVTGTTELASGLCRVPLTIPTGPAACTGSTVYRTGPAFLLGVGVDLEPQGPTRSACVDDSVFGGYGITSCVFLDDAFDWGDYGDNGQCTRFATPVAAICPATYAIDDSAGGTCWRFERVVDGVCPAGSLASGAFWCARFAEFEVFECPAGTVRRDTTTACNAFRDFQGAVSCGDALLVRSSAPDAVFGYGCFAFAGPQPDTCNGLGTIDDCYQILEPAAEACGADSGCVALGDFRVLGDVSCDGEPTLLDALLVAQFAEFASGYSTSCFNRPPGGVLGYDGDVNNDGAVDNADALLLLECGVGVDSFDGCAP